MSKQKTQFKIFKINGTELNAPATNKNLFLTFKGFHSAETSSTQTKQNHLSPLILHELGELRIRVFQEWPYLYQGHLEYEINYLQTYAKNPRSFAVLVRNQNNELIGATTAIPLEDEESEFLEPLRKKNFDPFKIVYFGESLLLPDYRGQGLGQLFMDARIEYAKQMDQRSHVAFCAVVRPKTHPLFDAKVRELQPFWRKNGFEPISGLTTYYKWRDIGEKVESEKLMQFWMKAL